MSEIVVVATMRARPEEVESVEQALAALVPLVHAEEGNLLYALHQGTEDPTAFAFVERWSSPEALEVHRTQPHMGEIFGRVLGLLEAPPEVFFLDPVLAGEPAKGSLAGS